MVCYRRYGHNELDQPMYTQPALYKKIAKHPDTLTVYEKQLIEEGTATTADLQAVRDTVMATLDDEFQQSKTGTCQSVVCLLSLHTSAYFSLPAPSLTNPPTTTIFLTADIGKSDWLSSKWAGFLSPHQRSLIQTTGVEMERLKDIGTCIYAYVYVYVYVLCIYIYIYVCVCFFMLSLAMYYSH